MFAIEYLAENWASRWAIHSLLVFESPNQATRERRNAAWNWGYLAVQLLALSAYSPTKEGLCGQVSLLHAVVFAAAVYGWIDLSLCVVRKTFLLHLQTKSDTTKSERIGSAWLMLVSLTIIYANIYMMLSMLGGKFVNALDSPAAALALSASTITTVGYGYYSPVGGIPVVLAYLQALSGIALVSCVIAAAVSSALSAPNTENAALARAAEVKFAHFALPWVILLVIFGSSVLFAMKSGCIFNA